MEMTIQKSFDKSWTAESITNLEVRGDMTLVMRFFSHRNLSGAVTFTASVNRHYPDHYEHFMFQDYFETFAADRVSRLTEKKITELHQKNYAAFAKKAVEKAASQYNYNPASVVI